MRRQQVLFVRSELVELNRRKSHHNIAERRKWQNPKEILVGIGLTPGMTFVDVGCGEGFFAVPAAEMVGEKGKVYAVDIDEEAIRSLKEEASSRNLNNITAKTGAAEDTVFCETCADFVFFGIVFHDFYDLQKVLSNAKKMLKSEGHLINLDWKKVDMEFGPPVGIRFSEKEAIGRIEGAGFAVENARNAGRYYYIISARPL